MSWPFKINENTQALLVKYNLVNLLTDLPGAVTQMLKSIE
jgi:hypothetical protein